MTGAQPLRLGLVGDPVAHSLSPAIHRHLLDQSGIPGSYEAVRTTVDELEPLLESMSRGVWDGLNVTMPLKELAASLVDQLSDVASKSGSVNTISRSDDRLLGDSTDAMAMVTLTSEDRFEDLETVLVLGTGGASLAALSVLSGKRRCLVAGRNEDRVNGLVDRFDCERWEWARPADGALLVNATPVTRLDSQMIEVAGGLIDLPYRRRPTDSVIVARRVGIPTVDGVEFLTTQAVESFRIWTSVEVTIEEPLERFRNT